MSKLDDKFVQNLQRFSDSLDELVGLLKAQAKIAPTDVVNKLLDNLDGEKIATIIQDLGTIKNHTEKINTNTEKILKEVQNIKTAKEGGMAATLGSPQAKNTVAEGVKSILLISVGVLALGLAFKIVGKVDFLSVIALASATYVIALTFEKIAKIDNLSPKKVLLISMSMVLMAGAIALSGYLLNSMPNMNVMSIVTVFVVTTAMTIALYGMSKALQHFKVTDWPKFLMLPSLLPLMALGIVGAGLILQNMPIIGWKTALSAGLVGIAMIPVALAMSLITKNLKNTNPVDVLMAAGMIPLMAGAIVVAGLILSQTPDIGWKTVLSAIQIGVALVPAAVVFAILTKSLKDVSWAQLLKATAAAVLISMAIVAAGMILQLTPDVSTKLVLNSWAIALAVLPFATLIWGINKLGLNLGAITTGAVGVVIISTAIMISSWILSVGNYDNYPSLGWSIGTGLALIAFSAPLIVLGLVAMTGIGLGALALGGLAVAMVAATIVATSYILGAGNYGNPVPLDWTLQTALAMLVFSPPILLLGAIALTGIGLVALMLGSLAVCMVAATIVETAKILAGGTYENYPTLGWSLGVALAMSAFALPSLALGVIILASFGLGLKALQLGLASSLMVAETLVAAAEILGQGNYSVYPSIEWAAGVGGAIMAFATALKEISNIGKVLGIFGGGLKPEEFTDFITTCAGAIIVAANEFAKNKVAFDPKNVPGKEWAEGVGGSVMAFATALKDISSIGESFLGGGGMTAGQFATAIGTLSHGIVAAGLIFSKYKGTFNKDGVPGKEWVEGVGGSVMAFATALKDINEVGKGFFGEGGMTADQFKAAVSMLAYGIIHVGRLFIVPGIFKSENVPTKEWVAGVGGAITTFAKALADLNKIDSDLWSKPGVFEGAMRRIVFTIIQTGKQFNAKGVSFKMDNMPSIAWTEGLGAVLDVFARLKLSDDNVTSAQNIPKIINQLGGLSRWLAFQQKLYPELYSVGGYMDQMAGGLQRLIEQLPKNESVEGIGNLVTYLQEFNKVINLGIVDSIVLLSNAITTLGAAINNLSNDKIDQLLKLTQGMQLLALIDETKLAGVLTVIRDKKSELTSIMDSGGLGSIFDQFIRTLSGTAGGPKSSRAASAGDISRSGPMVEKRSRSEEQLDTLIGVVKNIDTNIAAGNSNSKTYDGTPENVETAKSMPGFFGGKK